MRALILGLVLTIYGVSSANDSAISGVGGRPRMMQGEHAAIRMESENVEIFISKSKQYDVVARFNFVNDGPRATVKMGFPERAYGDVDGTTWAKKTSFAAFSSSVDGRPAAVTRQSLSAADDNDGDYSALWVKSVAFAPKQRRRVEVRYRAPFGDNTMAEDFAVYDFTGGNWRGTVAKSVLTVHFDRAGTFLVRAGSDKIKPTLARKNRDFVYTWQNWQAEDSFVFAFRSTLRDWLALAGLDPREEGMNLIPVKIDVAGQKREENKVGWLPAGVVRNNQIFVNARAWAENAKAGAVWDEKTRTLALNRGKISRTFTPGEDGVWTVESFSGRALFVPAKSLAAFGATFGADLPKHRLITFQDLQVPKN